MRKIILVAAMVLASAGAEAGQLRSLSLAGSDSKAVQDSAKSVEPASAVDASRAPKSANATSAGTTGASERQKFAERPPGIDVRRQSQMQQSQMQQSRMQQSRMQQSRMRDHASQRRAAPHMAGMGMRRPV